MRDRHKFIEIKNIVSQCEVHDKDKNIDRATEKEAEIERVFTG